MSASTQFVSGFVQRLSCHDRSLEMVSLSSQQLTDTELAELVDCLLAHPNVVRYVNIPVNRLTDETGVKLARYLAASSTVEWISLSHNQFTEATYLAVAAALRVNSSLQVLYLSDNQAVDQTRIDAAFVEALRLNPHRSAESAWWLYSASNDFSRLRDAADAGHPSLLSLLMMLTSDQRSNKTTDTKPASSKCIVW